MKNSIVTNVKRYSVSESIVHQSGKGNTRSGLEKFGLLAAVCIVMVVVIWVGAVFY